MTDLDAVLAEHLARGLERDDLDDDPVTQCRHWWDDAVRLGIRQPEAVALATAAADGRPSVRFVLLRGLERDGLRFYTNYGSRKARELDENPWAAMELAWIDIGRQVRIEGPVHRADAADSDGYWAGRPRGSQLASATSQQSEPVADRATMEAAVAAAAERWEGQEVPRPEGWGGYVLVPDRWEFWTQRPNRLHDRFVYEPDGAGGWSITRRWP